MSFDLVTVLHGKHGQSQTLCGSPKCQAQPMTLEKVNTKMLSRGLHFPTAVIVSPSLSHLLYLASSLRR